MSQNQEGTEILFEIAALYSYVENDNIVVPPIQQMTKVQ